MSTFTLKPSSHRVSSKLNAKTWANRFRARILEPGIVSYQDQDCGNALLRKETIDAHIHTFIGRPLILARDGMNRPTYKHAKVRPSNLEKMADGYISGVEYDPVDGWWYAVGTVHNEEAKQAIREIGYVSCAYDVKGLGGPGDYHNLPYHEEITAFEGEHLAIVDNPRYEEATIRLNAKTKPNHTMFKWIKKILASGENKQNSVESGELPEGAALEIDGTTVPVAEVVEGYKQNTKGAQELDGASEIEVDGKPVSVNALIASHQKLNAMEKEEEDKKNKKNADDEEEAKKKKEKENASDEDDEKKKEKEKENSKKTYKVNSAPGPISRAREAGVLVEVTNSAPDTQEAKLKRGQERYGARTK
jgi:hypothetical protein